MKVMLLNKDNYNQRVFIDNAIAVRVERDAFGIASWVIESAECRQHFMCMMWFVYLRYDER